LRSRESNWLLSEGRSGGEVTAALDAIKSVMASTDMDGWVAIPQTYRVTLTRSRSFKVAASKATIPQHLMSWMQRVGMTRLTSPICPSRSAAKLGVWRTGPPSRSGVDAWLEVAKRAPIRRRRAIPFAASGFRGYPLVMSALPTSLSSLRLLESARD
jgi:hypothetical protein